MYNHTILTNLLKLKAHIFKLFHDIVFITKVIRILRLSKQVFNQPYL